MSHLFGALNTEVTYCTFVVTRDFHSTTEFYQSTRPVEEAGGWDAFICREREGRRQRRASTGEQPDWDEGLDLADDDFVYACKNVRYASFYLGTTGGEPAPLIPRYEFLLPRPDGEVPSLVEETQDKLIRAVMGAGFLLDRDHNMFTGRRFTRVLPYVVHRAHESSKAFGGVLERVLHGAVATLLSRAQGRRMIGSDIGLDPVAPDDIVRGVLSAGESEWNENGEGDGD